MSGNLLLAGASSFLFYLVVVSSEMRIPFVDSTDRFLLSLLLLFYTRDRENTKIKKRNDAGIPTRCSLMNFLLLASLMVCA